MSTPKIHWTLGTVASLAVIIGFLYISLDRFTAWIDHRADDRAQQQERKVEWLVGAVVLILNHDGIQFTPPPGRGEGRAVGAPCPQPMSDSGLIAGEGCPK